MINEIKALLVKNGYNAISCNCSECIKRCKDNCINVLYAGMSYKKKKQKHITTDKLRLCFIRPSSPHQAIFEVLALLQDHKEELISGDFDCIYDANICTKRPECYVTDISFEKEQEL